MKTSVKGIDLIKSFEGLRLNAYDDLQPKILLSAATKIKGKLTIGYGHTGKIDGLPIMWYTHVTKAQALELLKCDLEKFEKNVMKYNKKYNWTQNEFDALVCFAYNNGSIDKLTALGTRSKAVIAQKILLYNKAGGKVLDGLTRRREEEKALFITK